MMFSLAVAVSCVAIANARLLAFNKSCIPSFGCEAVKFAIGECLLGDDYVQNFHACLCKKLLQDHGEGCGASSNALCGGDGSVCDYAKGGIPDMMCESFMDIPIVKYYTIECRKY